MNKIIIIYLIIGAITYQGCSTLKKSLALGAGSGAATGALLGSQIDSQKRQRGALIGAASGALIGGLASYLLHRDRKKSAKVLTSQILSGINDKSIPALKYPQVKRVWVPDQIEEDRYIKGHFIYLIDRPSVWTK